MITILNENGKREEKTFTVVGERESELVEFKQFAIKNEDSTCAFNFKYDIITEGLVCKMHVVPVGQGPLYMHYEELKWLASEFNDK